MSVVTLCWPPRRTSRSSADSWMASSLSPIARSSASSARCPGSRASTRQAARRTVVTRWRQRSSAVASNRGLPLRSSTAAPAARSRTGLGWRAGAARPTPRQACGRARRPRRPARWLAVPEPVDQGRDHLRVLERPSARQAAARTVAESSNIRPMKTGTIFRIVRSDQQRAPADRRVRVADQIEQLLRLEVAVPPPEGFHPVAAVGMARVHQQRRVERPELGDDHHPAAARSRLPPPGRLAVAEVGRAPGRLLVEPKSRRGSPARCPARVRRDAGLPKPAAHPVRRGACRSPRRWPRGSSPARRARDRPGAARAGARATPAPRSLERPHGLLRDEAVRHERRAAAPRPPGPRSPPAR